jgi:hypothetical protein
MPSHRWDGLWGFPWRRPKHGGRVPAGSPPPPPKVQSKIPDPPPLPPGVYIATCGGEPITAADQALYFDGTSDE